MSSNKEIIVGEKEFEALKRSSNYFIETLSKEQRNAFCPMFQDLLYYILALNEPSINFINKMEKVTYENRKIYSELLNSFQK